MASSELVSGKGWFVPVFRTFSLLTNRLTSVLSESIAIGGTAHVAMRTARKGVSFVSVIISKRIANLVYFP